MPRKHIPFCACSKSAVTQRQSMSSQLLSCWAYKSGTLHCAPSITFQAVKAAAGPASQVAESRCHLACYTAGHLIALLSATLLLDKLLDITTLWWLLCLCFFPCFQPEMSVTIRVNSSICTPEMCRDLTPFWLHWPQSAYPHQVLPQNLGPTPGGQWLWTCIEQCV